MLGKLLRSFNFGGVTVDTVFEDVACVPGGCILGEVRIKGGDANKDVNSISIAVRTQYKDECDDRTYYRETDLLNERLCGRFTVEAGQELKLPFTLQLPLNTPVTIGKSKVWVHTQVDIKKAIDPKDCDYLTVNPHPFQRAFIDAAERLGFCLYWVDVEKAFYRDGRRFKQEFEFKPASGEFAGKLDEIEAVFKLSEDRAVVRLQIDRCARSLRGLFAEGLDMDEDYTSLYFAPENIPHLDQLLADAIRPYC